MVKALAFLFVSLSLGAAAVVETSDLMIQAAEVMNARTGAGIVTQR